MLTNFKFPPQRNFFLPYPSCKPGLRTVADVVDVLTPLARNQAPQGLVLGETMSARFGSDGPGQTQHAARVLAL